MKINTLLISLLSGVLLAACGGPAEEVVDDTEPTLSVISALAVNDPEITYRIALENQSFTVAPGTVVQYGAGSAWIEKTFSGTATCSNQVFGGDPAPFVAKACYVMPVVATHIADEDESFTVAANTVVKYGAGTAWIEKTFSGTATCSNQVFGSDPAPFVSKACYSLGTGGGDPLESIDTDTDPSFASGAATMSVSGAQITIIANRDVQTAAAVYRNDGSMVRTLWRKINLTSGQSTSMTWDYLDDFGHLVGDGSYQIKAIAHNVGYKWQGVVGNSSNPGSSKVVPIQVNFDGGLTATVNTVGNQIHRSFHPYTNMAFDQNGHGFITSGYNEGQHGMGRIEIAQPQVRTNLLKADFQRTFELVATDGNVAYFANSGLYGEGFFNRPENFVIGVKVSDNSQYTFSSGSAWNVGIGYQNYWPNVIDAVADGVDQITGIAVEKNGTNLYVAHKNTGVKIFNKVSGQFLSSFAVPNPGQIAIAPSGDLWVIANNGAEVRKYTNPGGGRVLAMTVGGLTKAVGLGISPVTSTLVVVDGGSTQQQLKAYSTSNGSALWTQGAKGGYSAATGVDVNIQKFYFGDDRANYVAFEPAQNGEEIFWVGEPGNFRNLRLKIPANAAGSNPLVYMDQIMFVPHSYNASVDQGNPSRVFSSYLEFKVDYSKPIYAGGWALVKNWGINLPAGASVGDFIAGPRDVYTTPQGRTYAILIIKRFDWVNVIVELTPSGMRDTGITFPGDGHRFVENMNIRYSKKGSHYEIYQRDFTGIDGSSNPVWAAEKLVASAPLKNPAGSDNPYINHCANSAQDPRYPITSTGVLITFDPCAFADNGYDPSWHHLGGIKLGGSDYNFRSSPGGSFNLFGGAMIINGDGTFNTSNLGQNYAGSSAMAKGRQVMYGYFGEFWNNSQASQFMHWLDNGLFLGQFGQSGIPANVSEYAVVGNGGNEFAPHLVLVDGNYYLYHNDEHAHAGVHRWRVTNLNSVQEMVGNIGKNAIVSNPGSISSAPIAL